MKRITAQNKEQKHKNTKYKYGKYRLRNTEFTLDARQRTLVTAMALTSGCSAHGRWTHHPGLWAQALSISIMLRLRKILKEKNTEIHTYRNTEILVACSHQRLHRTRTMNPARPPGPVQASKLWQLGYRNMHLYLPIYGHLEMKYKTAELYLYANDRRPTSYCWRKYVLRDPLGFVPNFVLRLFSSSPQLCSNAPKLSEAKRDIAVSCLYKCTDTCLIYCNSDSIFTSFILKVFG